MGSAKEWSCDQNRGRNKEVNLNNWLISPEFRRNEFIQESMGDQSMVQYNVSKK